MAKQSTRKTTRQTKREHNIEEFIQQQDQSPTPIKVVPKTEGQYHYIEAIKNSTIILTEGPAGTGKTFIATMLAMEALRKDPRLNLILTRPVVEAGEKVGFLPGTIEEKYAPYLQPFRAIIEKFYRPGHLDYILQKKSGPIYPTPLCYMRGQTFENSWVILDEAQNTTVTQMKLFLTRLGEGSKLIINGDTDQVDIKEQSGLRDAILRLRGIPGVSIVRFDEEDVVRHGLIKYILKAYSNE
jgi:phosphate starvation-inducible PhoH-like protein